MSISISIAYTKLKGVKMRKIVVLLFAFLVSSLAAAEISTYLYGPFLSSTVVKNKLVHAGFTVIGEYNAMSNSDYHIIVYTSDALKKMGNKPKRTFASVQKVLISAKDKQIVFTNPNYFLRAFMQDDLNQEALKSISTSLMRAFPWLKGSKEALSEGDIKGYHFMFAMPYYGDMIEVAHGKNLDAILRANAKDKIVFELDLGTSKLYGINMDTKDGESAYIPAIKQQNHSAFLPYMVMVSDGKATILPAKYYLAISLPNLSMGQFMTISDAPGNIEDFFKGLFKEK